MKSTLTVMGQPPVQRLKVQVPYAPLLIDRFKTVPGRHYEPSDKTWDFPLVRDVVLMLCDILGLVPSMLPEGVKEHAAGMFQVAAAPPVDIEGVKDYYFKTAPFAHQRVNLARIVKECRWLIADEQGTGKTHAICNRIKFLAGGSSLVRRVTSEDFERRRVLIVCPKSVLKGWQDELALHANLGSVIIEGSRDRRNLLLCAGYPICIANYEIVRDNLDDFLAQEWTMLVLDEVHRCKNFTSQTCKALRKLSERATYVYGLSGTPAPNGLEDWFGVLSVVSPGLLPVNTKTTFEARYCLKQRVDNDGPFRIVGYRNVAELHQYIASITSRVTKAEALDLPEKVFSTRRVTLEGDQAQVYKSLKKDAVARLVSLKKEGTLTVRNVLTESLRLLQVVGGFVPDDDGVVHELTSKAKMQALADVLDEVGDRQVVIWCAFKAEVAYLTAWLQKNYAFAVSFTGDMSSNERSIALEQFKSKVGAYFVGTAAAGGTGINQLAGCDTVVYYSRNFSLTDYLQSQDRCHRIGSKNNVSIINLVATGTVDDTVAGALERKEEMQAMLLRPPEELF